MTRWQQVKENEVNKLAKVKHKTNFKERAGSWRRRR
jgi:hypothetical protein